MRTPLATACTDAALVHIAAQKAVDARVEEIATQLEQLERESESLRLAKVAAASASEAYRAMSEYAGVQRLK